MAHSASHLVEHPGSATAESHSTIRSLATAAAAVAASEAAALRAGGAAEAAVTAEHPNEEQGAEAQHQNAEATAAKEALSAKGAAAARLVKAGEHAVVAACHFPSKRPGCHSLPSPSLVEAVPHEAARQQQVQVRPQAPVVQVPRLLRICGRPNKRLEQRQHRPWQFARAPIRLASAPIHTRYHQC